MSKYNLIKKVTASALLMLCAAPVALTAAEAFDVYEATIDDATVFSRPWTIRMPLYRIVDENFRVLEFKCEPYAEEKIYGHLRKPGTEPPAGASSR